MCGLSCLSLLSLAHSLVLSFFFSFSPDHTLMCLFLLVLCAQLCRANEEPWTEDPVIIDPSVAQRVGSIPTTFKLALSSLTSNQTSPPVYQGQVFSTALASSMDGSTILFSLPLGSDDCFTQCNNNAKCVAVVDNFDTKTCRGLADTGPVSGVSTTIPTRSFLKIRSFRIVLSSSAHLGARFSTAPVTSAHLFELPYKHDCLDTCLAHTDCVAVYLVHRASTIQCIGLNRVGPHHGRPTNGGDDTISFTESLIKIGDFGISHELYRTFLLFSSASKNLGHKNPTAAPGNKDGSNGVLPETANADSKPKTVQTSEQAGLVDSANGSSTALHIFYFLLVTMGFTGFVMLSIRFVRSRRFRRPRPRVPARDTANLVAEEMSESDRASLLRVKTYDF
eukprot:m.182388 g.182388  ORF g.182388 m.182388 type:complete len:393 (+) comp25481_c1_seq2:1545-2723(+)